MTDKKQQFADIFDALKVAAEVMGDPLEASEYRAMAHRLLPFVGGALWRMIAALPGQHKKMPTGWDLEQEIRRTLGKPPMKGLTLDQIEENERRNVLSGQSPAMAKKSADLMRKALKERPEQLQPKTAIVTGEAAEDLMRAGAMRIEWDTEEGAVKTTTIDLISMLQDFGEETTNPLDALSEF